MRRKKIEVVAVREKTRRAQLGRIPFCDSVVVYDRGEYLFDAYRSLFTVSPTGFYRLFGFTPRPGKKIKIVMEIQEEKK